jgi:poly(3-hydroxybutyrate) depolymerase
MARSLVVVGVLVALTAACGVTSAGCHETSAGCQVESAACPEPFQPLASGTCIAVPPQVDDDTPVVVFLHGMTPSPEVALDHERELGRSAAGAGVVVVAPLGTVGLCGWSPEAAKSWCWPSHPKQLPETHALAIRLREDLKQVAHLLGRRGDVRPVLAGFSNGGFGAALLVASGEFEPAGLAVLHAGGPYRWEPKNPLPTLLRTATGDQWHHSTMVALRDQLTSVGWNAEWQERDGGHELTASDVAALVAFAKRAGAPVACEVAAP